MGGGSQPAPYQKQNIHQMITIDARSSFRYELLPNGSEFIDNYMNLKDEIIR